MTDVQIRPTRFGAPVAQRLIAAAQEDLTQRYGSGDANPVEPTEFDPPDGCFFVAWRDGEAVACGGWRTLALVNPAYPEDIAEVKRFFAVPAARGSGVAAELLHALEESAREAGMHHLWLETGQAQPEAIRFYTKYGYAPITHYGHYKDYPDVVSLARTL